MGFYTSRIVPHLIDWGCGMGSITEQRQRIVPRASGQVLELGIGSGRNLPLYDADAVERVWGVDPSPELYRMAADRAAELPFPVRFFVRPADEPGLALGDGSVDTVVVTYALCTIPDPVAALEEARRTLAPGGELLFAEHGRSPDPLALLAAAGFRVREIDTGYLAGWKPAAWHYLGVAVPA